MITTVVEALITSAQIFLSLLHYHGCDAILGISHVARHSRELGCDGLSTKISLVFKLIMSVTQPVIFQSAHHKHDHLSKGHVSFQLLCFTTFNTSKFVILCPLV